MVRFVHFMLETGLKHKKTEENKKKKTLNESGRKHQTIKIRTASVVIIQIRHVGNKTDVLALMKGFFKRCPSF